MLLFDHLFFISWALGQPDQAVDYYWLANRRANEKNRSSVKEHASQNIREKE